VSQRWSAKARELKIHYCQDNHAVLLFLLVCTNKGTQYKTTFQSVCSCVSVCACVRACVPASAFACSIYISVSEGCLPLFRFECQALYLNRNIIAITFLRNTALSF
jgi:hypothetical protein